MSRSRKYWSIIVWSILVAGMVAFVTAWAGARLARQDDPQRNSPTDANMAGGTALPVLYPAPSFTLTDQEGAAFGSDDLKGRPWIASFIFTRCTGPCPRMTRTMRKVQVDLDDPRVTLVSFTVDPAHDRPAVLAEYARSVDADPRSWHFLTGDKVSIYQIARGLKVTAVEATADAPIIHSTRFILVDGDGDVRGYYGSEDRRDMRKLVEDALLLARDGRP